jgi:hypothetical protein
VPISDVAPNPVAVDRCPVRTTRQDYLLWIGRMDPVKGAHGAIQARRVAGRALMLAGGGGPSSSVQSFAAIACLRILEGGLVQDLGAGR